MTAEDPFARALAAYHRGDFATAERAYRELPTHVNAIHNLGVLYYEHGYPDRAEAEFRHLLEARPNYQPSRFSLSTLLLAQRRYVEAWPLFDARLAVPNRRSVEAQADFPRWAGEPLAGKRIIACAEEGAGDQLMFGRYLQALRAAGAEVTFACDPGDLGRVFAAAGYETCTLTLRERQLPAADFWIPLGSLPRHLGGGAPPPPEYLSIPGTAGGGGVGVATRGNPIHPNDARRSLFGADAERLLALGRDLSPAATGAQDFYDTAEIVAGLDLVITVDTSVAHLAGALGKACWVLLPRLAMDWRWNDGRRSDWYPQMRLWRQPADGDWASLLAGVEQALAERPA